MKIGDPRLLQAKARLDDHRERFAVQAPDAGVPAAAPAVGRALEARPAGGGSGDPGSWGPLVGEPWPGMLAGADAQDQMGVDEGGVG